MDQVRPITSGHGQCVLTARWLTYMRRWTPDFLVAFQCRTDTLAVVYGVCACADDESKIAAKPASLKDISILALPMLFDLTATIMMSIGLLYVAASVYQMLRGAEILFSAIFAVCFLKRTLTKFHYGGIACCLVGIGMVGASSLLSSGSGSQSSDAGKVLLGMALIIVAQVSWCPRCTPLDE